MECSPANVTIVGGPSEPVKMNTNVQLMCSADNPTNSPLVYTWSTNGEELSGENRSTLVVSVKENLTVTCTAKNDVDNSLATTTIAVTGEVYQLGWSTIEKSLACLYTFFILLHHRSTRLFLCYYQLTHPLLHLTPGLTSLQQQHKL